MTLADAHIHLFEHGFPVTPLAEDGPHAELAAYERLRDEFGIEHALVVGYEGASFGTGNNRYIRHLATTRPWMSTVAHLPAAETSAITLAQVFDAGHVGVSLYLLNGADTAAVRGWPASSWAVLERAAAVVSLNAAPAAHADAAAIARRHPQVRFVWSHLGLPGPGAAPASLTDMLATAELGNCWVKLSGGYAIDRAGTSDAAGPIVSAVLGAFGASRVVWGSDFAPVLRHSGFADTLRPLAALDPEVRAAVGRDSLLALLRS